jgi:hypothetical protein
MLSEHVLKMELRNRFCYAAVVAGQSWSIGLVEDRPGYQPKPEYGECPTFEAAHKYTDNLNWFMFPTLSAEACAQIVASSMRTQNRGEKL